MMVHDADVDHPTSSDEVDKMVYCVVWLDMSLFDMRYLYSNDELIRYWNDRVAAEKAAAYYTEHEDEEGCHFVVPRLLSGIRDQC